MDIKILIKRKEKEFNNVTETILDFGRSEDAELLKAIPIYESKRIELQTELEALREKESRQRGCDWCNRTDGYARTECTLVDHEGNNLVVDHMIVSSIADYCPKCGKKLTNK